MKRNRMFELGFTQLGIFGGVVVALGLYVMAEHSKYWGLWVLFAGVVIVGAGAVVQLQKVLWEDSTPRPQLSIIQGDFGTDGIICRVVIKLKNTSAATAYDVQTWLTGSIVEETKVSNPTFTAAKLGPDDPKGIIGPGVIVDMPYEFSTTSAVSDATVLAAIAKKILAGEMTVFIWGEAHYRGESSAIKDLYFRYRAVRLGNGWVLKPTAKGNTENRNEIDFTP